MKWTIPAKTFLLGEYAALKEGPAILVTTSPYFQVSLQQAELQSSLDLELGYESIHPDSPAGRWWHSQQIIKYTLQWHDPYSGCGGLGASSAQFIGSYLASCRLNRTKPTLKGMLEAYYHCAWDGQGLRPSGYDVIAQTLYGCVYINQQKKQIQTYSWPFDNLSFLLVHTGSKLATHHHLQKAVLPDQIEQLSALVETAKQAFEHRASDLLIECINAYHDELAKLQLVAAHSLELINVLRNCPEVLAIKGCGALGADILLIITTANQRSSLKNKLLSQNKKLLATECGLVPGKKNLLYF